MKRRGGFTLLELLVALTLTGVVALLVYGVAAVALDTEERLEAQQLASRSERAWHAVVEDALRNVRANSDYPRATLALEQHFDAMGRPQDRLEFITAGWTPPLTGDSDWSVRIESAGGHLVLTATPIGLNTPTPRVVEWPAATGLDVAAFGGLQQPTWVETWADRRILPLALELTYWTDAGSPGAPVVITLPAGSRP